MSTVAEKLLPYGFVRIHRSVLINASFVEELPALEWHEENSQLLPAPVPGWETKRATLAVTSLRLLDRQSMEAIFDVASKQFDHRPSLDRNKLSC
jgi:hypothetical protein